ncbi:MAG: hypothetical protein MI919_34050, partial [Holophagales bacterium]|nr:hypothetical protein [Holophagales bacterium]
MLPPRFGTARARRAPIVIAALLLGISIPWTLPSAALAQATCSFVDGAGQPAGPAFSAVAGTPLRARVTDVAENSDSIRFDSLYVELQATQSGDQLYSLELLETGRDTGIFEAVVELGALTGGAGADPYDSLLQTELTDTAELIYFPASGGAHCVATAPVIPAGLELVDERLGSWVGPAQADTVLADTVLRVRLRAPGQNLSSSSVESLPAAVASEVLGDSEAVTLVETAVDSGVFEGTIQLRTDYLQGGNGVLELVPPYLPQATTPERVVATQADTGTSTGADVVWARLAWIDAAGGSLPAFVPGEAVALRLDRPMWDDPLSADSLQVTVATDSGDQETLSLLETGPAAAIFEVALATAEAAPVTGDGLLQATPPPGGGPGLATADYSDSYLPGAAEATAALNGSRMRILTPFGAGAGEIFQTAPFEVEVIDFGASGSVAIQTNSVLAADAEGASLPQVAPGMFRGSVATDLTQLPNQTGTPGDGVLTTSG